VVDDVASRLRPFLSVMMSKPSMLSSAAFRHILKKCRFLTLQRSRKPPLLGDCRRVQNLTGGRVVLDIVRAWSRNLGPAVKNSVAKRRAYVRCGEGVLPSHRLCSLCKRANYLASQANIQSYTTEKFVPTFKGGLDESTRVRGFDGALFL
jgi:hypothetical protein